MLAETDDPPTRLHPVNPIACPGSSAEDLANLSTNPGGYSISSSIVIMRVAGSVSRAKVGSNFMAGP